MATLAPPPPRSERSARNGVDFLRDLGDVPWERILFDPPPGTVTADYYSAIDGRVGEMLVELVDGTLVANALGFWESVIGCNLMVPLWHAVKQRKLGFVIGAAGAVRLANGNGRMPDVAVYLRSDLPNGKLPKERVPQIPPRLTVQILKEDNTAAEIDKKLLEFFASGCRLAYVIDPKARTARRYTSPDDFNTIEVDGVLDGGDVLPGFELALATLFEEE